MKKRLYFSLFVVMLMAGCGTSGYELANDTAVVATEQSATEEAVEVMAEDAGGIESDMELSEAVQADRKLIRTFELEIETKEFDDVLSDIQTKVAELGGYIENSSLDSGSAYYSTYNRYSSLKVRVPSDQLDGFVAQVKEQANVTYVSESTEDITLQYVDTQSHKTALETEQNRLLELLEAAETVEDLIAIESRLSEVRYQLESYTSQLRIYDNQVDYSTVHITIREVDRETKSEPKTFWEEVGEAFADSLYGIRQGARGLAICVLGAVPYMFLWALVIVAVGIVVRRIRKKKAVKTEE